MKHKFTGNLPNIPTVNSAHKRVFSYLPLSQKVCEDRITSAQLTQQYYSAKTGKWCLDYYSRAYRRHRSGTIINTANLFYIGICLTMDNSIQRYGDAYFLILNKIRYELQ